MTKEQEQLDAHLCAAGYDDERHSEDGYKGFVLKRFLNKSTGNDGLLHGTIGIIKEAGELLDHINRVWAHNQPIDRDNVVEELGDILFYTTALMSLLNISRQEVIDHNVTKLRIRYPEKYTDELLVARLDKR